MNRFTDETVNELKRVMLTRMQDCLFTSEDYDSIAAVTGLNKDQITHWARNMRFRYSAEEREQYLRSDATYEKVT
jgi:hypothetical protein